MRFLICPRCNTPNAIGTQSCVLCGFELNSKFCSQCGTKLPIEAETCGNCGADTVKYLFVPTIIKEIEDQKYTIYSHEKHGTIVKEISPNLSKIKFDSHLSQFYASQGNLIDLIQISKDNLFPVLEKPKTYKTIEEIWEESGEREKVKFLLKIVENYSKFDLFYPEKIEEILYDEKLRPVFQVREEKVKGFSNLDELLCKIISNFKGNKDSLWETEKSEILKRKCETKFVLIWLKELEKKLEIPKIKYHGLSDKGPVRQNNEDAIIMIHAKVESELKDYQEVNSKYLFVLTDGLGGHERGEVAAGLIIESIRKEFFKNLLPKKKIEVKDIIESVEVINNYVYARNVNAGDQTQRMGGTISGLIIENEKFFAFNVGDSPIFLITEDMITEISTRDISPSKPKAITQAIGVRDSQNLDVHIFELKIPANKFKILICSDGLTDVVDEKEIIKTMNENKDNLNGICDVLLNLAYKKKTSDNVSMIIIDVERETLTGKEL